jgi:hypothetical protein
MDSVDTGAAKERPRNQALKHEQPFRRCKQKIEKNNSKKLSFAS